MLTDLGLWESALLAIIFWTEYFIIIPEIINSEIFVLKMNSGLCLLQVESKMQQGDSRCVTDK